MVNNDLVKRVENLEQIVKQLVNGKVTKIRKALGIGDTFELAGLTWKILDITDKGYMCLAEKLEERMAFDSDCSNWQESNLRNYLNRDFCNKLAREIGEDNIIPFERSLLSLDGQTEYGSCVDKVSLLTIDEYRKYRGLIPNTDDYWWWLVTPWSTPCNDYETTMAFVSSSGCISCRSCNDVGGVRPFCIFSSAIFASEEFE